MAGQHSSRVEAMQQQRPGLPSSILSNNLPAMSRWCPFLSAILLAAVAFACNDDLVQDVAPEVCVTEKQWVGGKRGSPEMYPGRDCVGCHVDNDGPELMLGGTVYPYVEYVATPAAVEAFKQLQSGEDCFGQPNVDLKITGGDGQEFLVTTNEAGNFYIEGKPSDLVKPFTVELSFFDPATGFRADPKMGTPPHYGGCAQCHTPGVTRNDGDDVPYDKQVKPASSYIGVPGFIQLKERFPAAAP